MTSIVPERILRPTPGQTVGPFFAYGLEYPKQHEVAFSHSPGAILLGGTVYDGAGAPVPDALVEIWGADEHGVIPRARGAIRRDDHTFTGFGRAFTNDDGRYELWTREPGFETRPPASGAPQPVRAVAAPFFAAIVFARGLPDKLHTRIYLPDSAALADDQLLAPLDDGERATLIATRTDRGRLEHDIRLQGEGETVFLAF